MHIPFDKLSPEALHSLIEEFVTRDGTDSGFAGKSLEKDIAAVKRQLRQGRAVIVFDHETRSCNIIPRDDIKERLK